MAKTSKTRKASIVFEEVTPKAGTETSPPVSVGKPHPLPQRGTRTADIDGLRTQIATGFSEIMKQLRSVREEIRVVREEVKLVRSEVGSVITKKTLRGNRMAEATDPNEENGKSEMETVKMREETLGDNLTTDAADFNEERKKTKFVVVETETVITRKEERSGDNQTAKVTDRKERKESKMGMERKPRKKVATRTEKVAEDWCFICKDGGKLLICDDKKCSKTYHRKCMEAQDTTLGNEDHWRCAWHYCMCCEKSADVHCYTCPKAVCRCCLPMAAFMLVKKQYGLCDECLKLARHIEENKKYDSDGDPVDFTNRETRDGLFMEYYMIIKDQEGFDLSDLRGEGNQSNKKNNLKESEQDKARKEMPDGDSLENRHRGKKRREKSKFVTKNYKRLELSWASEPLIGFLASIGKNGKEELSRREVGLIINDYINENKLLDPDEKTVILCDERLRALFRERTLRKHEVSYYLEAHFAGDIDEDELTDVTNKRQKVTVEEGPEENVRVVTLPDSCFAAIVVENMNLVYLKRMWIDELLNSPESFKEKVMRSFVRIKSNSNDSTTKNSHRLLQVTGVKDATDGEISSETILLLSNKPGELPINQLADGEITMEECEELRLKMLAGDLKRPTVEELQKKANLLHEDITCFKISRELRLLKNLIEHANEKGWRNRLFGYFDRRKILQSPSEVAKMIEALPTVIPELESTNKDNITADSKSNDGPN